MREEGGVADWVSDSEPFLSLYTLTFHQIVNYSPIGLINLRVVKYDVDIGYCI